MTKRSIASALTLANLYSFAASPPTASVSLDGASSFYEGDSISIEVRLDPAPDSPIMVSYELVSDVDPRTADAASNDFEVATVGTVSVGSNGVKVIEIVSADDREIERADGEYFELRLTAMPVSDYRLGSPSSVTLHISEGVCDRTPEIRDRIVSRLAVECEHVTNTDLFNIQSFSTGRLTSLQAKDLWGLSNLKWLHLCGGEATQYSPRSGLKRLPTDLFNQVPELSSNLLDLTIHGCSISELPNEFLTEFKALAALNLSEPLTKLPAFPRYGRLKSLTLDGLAITDIPASAFAASGLESLYIQHNSSLNTVSPDAFKDLPGLLGLSVSWSAIREWPSAVFSQLPKLSWLQIANGAFSSIENLEFPSGLTLLNLNGNALTSLPAELGARLPNLKDFRVEEQAGNVPIALLNETFAGMSSLESLQLARNRIAELPIGVFQGLSNLRWLRLNHNELNSLPDGIFHDIPQIEAFNVVGNPGVPFPVVFELDRVDGIDEHDAPARVIVNSVLGFPSDVTIGISTFNASADKKHVSIGRRDKSSEEIVVRNIGEDAGHVALGPILSAQSSYSALVQGFELKVGSPLVLFKSSNNLMPNPEVAIASRKLQVNGAPWHANMERCFRDFDDHTLTFSATSSAQTLVRISYSESGLLSFEPEGEGVATITAIATDPLGAYVSQDFEIEVEAASDPSKFDIHLDYMNFDEVSDEIYTAISGAAARWMEVIVGDLPENPIVAPPACDDHSQPFTGEVDDIRITVSPINNASNIAGSATPTAIRENSGLPFLGRIHVRTTLDPERVQEIALHEIGHALGFAPALWARLGYFHNPSRTLGSGADTHFSGALAQLAFDEAGGESFSTRSKVPLHNGGYFNSDSHWPFAEIMGVGADGALSAITVQLFADLGYTVDATKADAFRLPSEYHASYNTPFNVQDNNFRGQRAGSLLVGRNIQAEFSLPTQSIKVINDKGAVVEVLEPHPAH